MYVGELKVEDDERVTNNREIEPFEDFRAKQTAKQKEKDQLEVNKLEIEIECLKIKLYSKINEFKAGNGKSNLNNIELIKDIHNYSNCIIKRQCKINLLKIFEDSEDLVI